MTWRTKNPPNKEGRYLVTIKGTLAELLDKRTERNMAVIGIGTYCLHRAYLTM